MCTIPFQYVPVVDHLRQLDESTFIGKMTVGSYTIIYFTLSVPSSWGREQVQMVVNKDIYDLSEYYVQGNLSTKWQNAL